MKTQMPMVDVTSLTTEEKQIVNLFLKKDGSIRASKPKSTDNPYSFQAQYVWRNLVFYVSPKPQHHCIPATANFSIYDYFEKCHKHPDNSDLSKRVREKCKELDVLVDKLLETIPKTKWHGVRRWNTAIYG